MKLEARMTKEIRSIKHETVSDFGLRASFDIRISSFEFSTVGTSRLTVYNQANIPNPP